MRCATCGTHNEPDSRFCGGCGARLAGTLAPTHRIVANPALGSNAPPPASAPLPAPSREQQAQAIARQVSAEYNAQRQPSGPQAAPRPPSVNDVVPARPRSAQDVRRPSAQDLVQRPQNPPPASAPPSSNPAQPVQRPPSVQGVSASPVRSTPNEVGPTNSRSLEESYAVPKRRIGLILIVLAFDLGLAAAGVYLLNEGLSTGNANAQDTTPTGSAAVAPAPAPTQAAVAPAPKPNPKPVEKPAAANAPAGSGAVPAGSATPASSEPKPAGSGQVKQVARDRAPVDPYADPANREGRSP